MRLDQIEKKLDKLINRKLELEKENEMLRTEIERYREIVKEILVRIQVLKETLKDLKFESEVLKK